MDFIFEDKIKNNEWFEFWAISKSDAYTFHCFLRWLFDPSNNSSRECRLTLIIFTKNSFEESVQNSNKSTVYQKINIKSKEIPHYEESWAFKEVIIIYMWSIYHADRKSQVTSCESHDATHMSVQFSLMELWSITGGPTQNFPDNFINLSWIVSPCFSFIFSFWEMKKRFHKIFWEN